MCMNMVTTARKFTHFTPLFSFILLITCELKKLKDIAIYMKIQLDREIKE